MPNRLSECDVIKVWQHQLLDRRRLLTEDGKLIEVIYPGRINDDQGADFRDAVIATSRGLVRGDIEVHVKSSDWWHHRHHKDAVYNRVILHVVMWQNNKTATNLQNGRAVPILALDKYIKTPLSQESELACPPTAISMPCYKATPRPTTGTMAELLDKAGEERFLTKAAKFRADLAQMEASQSLYQGIMGSLGYSKNKLPFLELAQRLPLQILESIAKRETSGEECLAWQQALLLETAGLLPSQYQDGHRESVLNGGWIDTLERLWASSHYTKIMSQNDWHLFKVRPYNSPTRRLVAMSYLVLRYREKGILEELVKLIKEVPLSQGYHRLEEGLLVIDDDHRASQFDFSSGRGMRRLTLLGRERAADITVNVLLPSVFALGQFTSQVALEKKALELYRHYPNLAINSIERHMMNQLGISCSAVKSAQQQQGLIHIYSHLCTQGKCNECLLSQLEAGHYIQV
ncbi:DUF2851 family protein [Chloroflexota bacterium]